MIFGEKVWGESLAGGRCEVGGVGWGVAQQDDFEFSSDQESDCYELSVIV